MCADCKTTPFAYITSGGVLVIASRHHGDKHINILTIEELQKAIDDFKAEVGTSKEAISEAKFS